MTAEERQSAENGIWLCEICAKLIDVDVVEHPPAVLREWKGIAEAAAYLEMKGFKVGPDRRASLKKLEVDLPELFADMRGIIQSHPHMREFILMRWESSYNAGPDNPVIAFYFNDHTDLRQKIRVLENHLLVQDITYNNVDRFVMSEELVNYLKSG